MGVRWPHVYSSLLNYVSNTQPSIAAIGIVILREIFGESKENVIETVGR